MPSIESKISALVEQQFPSFYHSEGPQFVSFVKKYFEWMETSGQTIYESRALLKNLDLDETVETFAKYFKAAYLNGLPSANVETQAFQTKHILDLYRSKGTKEGMELFFRMFYQTEADIYKPGTDVLKASSGYWNIRKYIEMHPHDSLEDYVGKQITGSTSRATAIVECYYRRNIFGKLVDVLCISNIRGNFQANEYVTYDNSLIGVPKILGSLTTADIVDGGFAIANGDVFDISGDNGKYGSARVSATVNGSGQVDFQLLDGGSGFSLANTVVTISNTVIFHSGNTINANNFSVNESVVQNVFTFSTSNNVISNSSLISVYNSSNTLLGNAVVIFANSGNIRIVTDTGNLSTANKLVVTSNAIINSIVSNVSSLSINANVMAINSVAVGLINTSNSFVLGGFFRGLTSNCIALTTRVSTGSNASFVISSVSNTEIALSQNVGTILSLGSIKPGSNYDTPPMIRINNPLIAAGGKYDWTVGVANVSGTFLANQSILTTSNTGGRIRSANSTHLKIIRSLYADTMANNQQIVSYFANGIVSGVGTISSVVNDTNYLMGNNAIVSSNATSLSGVVSEVEILDCGYGYIQNEILTFTSTSNSEITFTGSANILRQGKSIGHWEYNNSRLNSNKYVHDNDYYQEYSYEIQTSISIDKYAEVLRQLMHIVGTKMFGKVIRNSYKELRLESSLTEISTYVDSAPAPPPSGSGGALLLNNAEDTGFVYLIGYY